MATIRGTKGNNVLKGTKGEDFIYGMAGNDQIRAGAGPDEVWDGPGKDIVWGEAGNDHFAITLSSTTSARWQGGPGSDIFELWHFRDYAPAMRVTINDFQPGVDALIMNRNPVTQFDVNRDGKLSKLDGMRVVLANGDYFHFKTDPLTNTQALELKIDAATVVLLKVAELY